jgi:hypothetical protein
VHYLAGWLRERTLSRRFRAMISSWPGYQHLPDGSWTYLIKLKVRVFSSLTSGMLRMPIRDLLSMVFQKIDIQGRKDRILVIANGPSASLLTQEQLRTFKKNGGQIAAMNGYIFSHFAEEFPPDLFFAADPDIWNAPQENDWKFTKRLEFLCSRNWKNTIIVQPIHQAKLVVGHPHYLYLTPFSSAGLLALKNPFFIWGLTPSTALLAFSLVKKIGFKEVYFAGMDGDSYRGYSTNLLGNIEWTSSKHHFYSSQSGGSEDYIGSSFEGVLFNKQLIPSLADAIYAEAILRRDFHIVSQGMFVNVTPSLYSDHGASACLLALE